MTRWYQASLGISYLFILQRIHIRAGPEIDSAPMALHLNGLDKRLTTG
jgi:hypothetical protein